jgi:ADP-ribosylglycohydrolase
MAGKRITVVIDSVTGDANIEAHGFHGKGCGAIIKSLTEALGGTITSEKTKREYFEPEEMCLLTHTR